MFQICHFYIIFTIANVAGFCGLFTQELAQFHAKAKARRKSRQKRVQFLGCRIWKSSDSSDGPLEKCRFAVSSQVSVPLQGTGKNTKMAQFEQNIAWKEPTINMLMPGRSLSDHVDGGHDQQKNTAVATFCDALSKCACSLHRCIFKQVVVKRRRLQVQIRRLSKPFSWGVHFGIISSILFLIPQHS